MWWAFSGQPTAIKLQNSNNREFTVEKETTHKIRMKSQHIRQMFQRICGGHLVINLTTNTTPLKLQDLNNREFIVPKN